MLRLIINKGCATLCKSSHFLTSTRQMCGFLMLDRTRLQVNNLSHFSTGGAVWKDALEMKQDKSEETETLDLDRWKSVMISQATFKEQDVSEEVKANAEGEILEDSGGISKERSSLEATRELVLMWRQAGKLVPQEMTEEQVRTLAELDTKSGRKKYLKFLATKERYKLVQKEKQQRKKAEREASMTEQRELDGNTEEEDGQRGHKMKNTMFLQFWDRSLDKVLAWRSAQAMRFDQPLVFDMSYESNMSRREIDNTVAQLLEVEGWNRRATEPFHLHFCNLQPDAPYKKELLKRYGPETWDRLLVTSTERQHIDLFPREQLVYLTADSPNVLRSFDHSKVYVIGALVDRSIQSGLSLANAKRLKLATARLPLDEYLHWEVGAKNLTLDQMIRIMLTVKDTGKWEEALKFVPTRKHDGFHQQKTQSKATNNTARSLTNRGSRQNDVEFVKSGERDTGRMFLNLNKSDKKSTFIGRDRWPGSPNARESKQSPTKVRTSFKSDMEAKKIPRKHNTWWHDE
ncbi:tRNA methyltransferase 10 homolog C [Cololabis saira]|uniref:tRNA methyltransferase 10 homolog C n=1 Tax=Cololabis saira TaxID=129043 RepID=UPI002AD44D55|nr:tRNA methyltransferase 10 homolog C [Cololabis saira]